jgi:hypothetical protein
MDLSRTHGGLAQRTDDRVELAGWPVAEERERDMQVFTRDDADIPQLLALPALDLVEDAAGQTQREKEP